MPKTFKAKPGEFNHVKKPVFRISGVGSKTKLTAGNADGYDLEYASVSGKKTLEKLAKEILKTLKSK